MTKDRQHHAGVRVSVIVPVYNTGVHIEELIRSLDAQTLPPDQFECIFVDDGSTDETPARLDRLAAERSNVTVLHEPNSGWPGRPRNVGIDHARGTYVFFVDHDDWLGDEALQRMTAMADAESADVLVPRYAGHRRGVARSLFERPRPNASLDNTPLMDSLTPHKLFRRSFLIEHNLRFPEGRRRLEDHVFVTEAYFLARRISVLTDYHCYFHIGREDAGNAGYQRIDPPSYYGYVREVIAVILKYTEPGSVRDRYLRRFMRIEILSRLSGEAFLGQDPAYQRSLFDEGRRVAMDHMPPSVDAEMPAAQRTAAYLVRADAFDDLLRFVRWQTHVRAEATAVALTSDRRGRLHLDVAARLIDKATRGPWTYARTGDSIAIDVPPELHTAIPPDVLDATTAIEKGATQIVLRRRKDSEEWTPAAESRLAMNDTDGSPWVAYDTSAVIDPRTAGGGHPLSTGTWDVYVRIRQTGWTQQARLSGGSSALQALGVRTTGGNRYVTAFLTDKGNLSLKVEYHRGLRRRIRRRVGALARRLRWSA